MHCHYAFKLSEQWGWQWELRIDNSWYLIIVNTWPVIYDEFRKSGKFGLPFCIIMNFVVQFYYAPFTPFILPWTVRVITMIKVTRWQQLSEFFQNAAGDQSDLIPNVKDIKLPSNFLSSQTTPQQLDIIVRQLSHELTRLQEAKNTQRKVKYLMKQWPLSVVECAEYSYVLLNYTLF